MRTAVRLTAIAALIAFVMAGGPVPAEATFPGTNGRLLYLGPGDLWTVKPNGSEAMRLTYSGAGWTEPQWSPDGSRIAFGRDNDIWVMNADGTDETDLASGDHLGGYPSWTPDGNHITYVGINSQLWTIDPNGSNNNQLTNWVGGPNPGTPLWAPDGSSIAFNASTGANNQFDIWVAPSSDLNSPVQITDDAALERDLSWAPDSSLIAYEREASSDHQRDIYSVKPDGSNVLRLTTNTAVDAHPTWSPDGTKIAFRSERVTNGAMYLMNADGSNEIRVTPRGSGGSPLWQPCPSTCASVVEQVPPSSTIALPVDGDSYTPSRIKSFAGTAADETSGVRRVDLSLLKRAADGACRWWNGFGFVAGECKHPMWFAASGRASWTYTLSARLRRTSGSAAYYRLRSRATDRVGNVEGGFVAGANEATFEVE